jgi:hypothetical protein
MPVTIKILMKGHFIDEVDRAMDKCKVYDEVVLLN